MCVSSYWYSADRTARAGAIVKHTSGYVRIRQFRYTADRIARAGAIVKDGITLEVEESCLRGHEAIRHDELLSYTRSHTFAYVRICSHMFAYVSIREHT